MSVRVHVMSLGHFAYPDDLPVNSLLSGMQLIYNLPLASAHHLCTVYYHMLLREPDLVEQHTVVLKKVANVHLDK